MNSLTPILEVLAQHQRVALAPDWAGLVPGEAGPDDLAGIICQLRWSARACAKPKVQDFPMLAWHADSGWALAERCSQEGAVLLLTAVGQIEVEPGDQLTLWKVAVAGDTVLRGNGKALSVFWSAIMRRKAMLLDATVATVVINVIALVTSIYSMQVYDRVIPRSGFATLAVLTAGMVIALLFDTVIRNTRAILIDRTADEIDSEVTEYFYDRMQAVRLDVRPKSIGTMAAQLRGTEQVRSLLSSASLFVLADLPFAVLFIVIMASLGGVVALVPLIAFPLSLLLAATLARLIRTEAGAAQISGNRKNGLLVEALDSAETIKANLGGWTMLAKWNRLVDDVHHHDFKVKRWSTYSGSAFSLVQQLAYVGVVCVGALEVSKGAMTMGAVIACSILSGRVNGPLIASLPGFIVQWGYARSSLEALDSILAMPSDRPEDQQKIRHLRSQGAIKITDLAFEHQGARAGVRVERLELRAGERVGVIGPIGSGKSTFLRLLAGLYAPGKGLVTLDGIDLQQIAEEDLRRHVCYVPQDYRLINGTLRDNLVMGLGALSDADLLLAAEKSGLAELVSNHPRGFDLPISEGGMGLSGGQRALVGLTRVLLARPRIVLLDEPSAALDGETEGKVLQALLHGIDKDAVVVFVTHKQQLLGLFSRLLVIGRGQLIADGPTGAVLEHLRPKPNRTTPASAPLSVQVRPATQGAGQ